MAAATERRIEDVDMEERGWGTAADEGGVATKLRHAVDGEPRSGRSERERYQGPARRQRKSRGGRRGLPVLADVGAGRGAPQEEGGRHGPRNGTGERARSRIPLRAPPRSLLPTRSASRGERGKGDRGEGGRVDG
jgi:hypothetical protein